MNNPILRRALPIVVVALLVFVSCRTSYEVTEVEVSRLTVDSSLDTLDYSPMTALLAPYRHGVDSMMTRVVGTAAMSMDNSRPEDLLSNLVADVLRYAAKPILGKEADMGLVNLGGLRATLSEGTITCGNVYEILPFENSLCVLTLKGEQMRQLLETIARRGGEGVSGIQILISRDGDLLEARVGGQPINPDATYTVATIDYLAEGNSDMTALTLATERICPEGATLRGLFMDYVERETAAGRVITSKIEGRIRVKE